MVMAGAVATDPASGPASTASQLQLQSRSPVAVGPLLGVTSTIADTAAVSAAIDAAVTSRLQAKGGTNNSNSDSNPQSAGRAPATTTSPATTANTAAVPDATVASGGSGRRRIVANVPLVDLSHLGPDAGWRQHVTDDGLVYYSNDQTAATTWDRPMCLGQLILEEDADVVVMVGDAQATVIEPSDSTDVLGAAEPHHALNGAVPDDTRVEGPAAVSRGAEPPAAAAPAGVDQHQPQHEHEPQQQQELPELFHESYRGLNGWLSTTDEEGYVYYVHEPTGTTQWERPEGFA